LQLNKKGSHKFIERKPKELMIKMTMICLPLVDHGLICLCLISWSMVGSILKQGKERRERPRPSFYKVVVHHDVVVLSAL
jgi:hypothetical protein